LYDVGDVGETLYDVGDVALKLGGVEGLKPIGEEEALSPVDDELL
jgi:hypothetical protein